jgi:AraC-like DNA-binding protein
MNTNWTSATLDWTWRTSEPVFAAPEVHSDFKWTVRRGLSRRTLALACSYMEENLGENFTLGDLGKAADVSPFHFSRLFRVSTGQSPMAYWRRLRIERAKEMLLHARRGQLLESKAFVMKANQLLLATILASAIGAPIETLAEDKSVMQQIMPAAFRLPVEGELPSLGSATGWLNSQPLTATSLRGKVVLVEFWTYSCINWLRTLPYFRAWAEKYKCRGLVVIGVHSPEFQFEKNVDNVRLAAKDIKVDYPIAIDSDYAIWRAFKNRYWPALFRRCTRTHSTSSIRRGRIGAVGEGHPAIAGRGRKRGHRS